jgi:hypothetical protein
MAGKGGDVLRFEEYSRMGGGEYSRCWPRDWLPTDLPSARVIAINYTTDPYLWRPFWIQKRNR